jgi:hypothetical protein
MEMNMTTEGYKGIGRAARREMIRRWKASGSKSSLKQWACKQGVGDAADVWFKAKTGKS